MLLFRDEEHVDRWCSARDMPRGAIITPEQTWRLAEGWYRAVSYTHLTLPTKA